MFSVIQGASGAYLFLYTDSAGNGAGFIEAAPQIAGSRSDFLFATGAISNIVFNGLAPSICSVSTGVINDPDAGCIAVNTGPVPAHVPAFSTFDPGSFGSAGTFTSQFGGFATVKVIQLSGFMFLYQDNFGDIVVFSEPTPASSGSVSDFIFASGATSQLVFNGVPPS